MNLDVLRRYCVTLPGATRDIKWGADEVYSVGGKMFAVFWIENRHAKTVSLKSDPARFLELTDVPGIVPAPYLARAHWVQVRTPDALPEADMRRLLHCSHRTVLSGLPKKTQAAIVQAACEGCSPAGATPRGNVPRKRTRKPTP